MAPITTDAVGVRHLQVPQTLNIETATTFRDDVRALAERDGVRVVVLGNDGRFFCLGGDLGWMQRQPDRQDAVHRLATVLHESVIALRALEAPVLARVHGVAAGAGLSLVLGADIAVASSSATFTMAYAGVGLSPDGGASWLLPRIVGHSRAREIILSNRTISADEAASLGIVASTATPADLDDAVDALAGSLATGPAPAYAATKQLLDAAPYWSLEDHLIAEARSIATLAGEPTGTEGVDAFLERRAPRY